MNEVINNAVYEFIDKFNMNNDVVRYKKLKTEILKDDVVLSDFKNIKRLDKNTNEYKELKYKLFENNKVEEYLSLENKINFDIMYLNMELKKLMDKKKCI